MENSIQGEHERPYRKKIHQILDPSVSQVKFQREVETFKASAVSYRVRGIFLISAEFPIVHVLFTAPHLKPTPVVFAAKFDFTNYDADAPSLVLVDPFSLSPISFENIGNPFPRLVQVEGQQPYPQFYLQHYGADDIPFLCMEGVREYHLHPAHTGNSWFRHRGNGKGTLGFLVDQVYNYGVLTLNSPQFQFIGHQIVAR